MNKLSCGVVVLTLGMMSPVQAIDKGTLPGYSSTNPETGSSSANWGKVDTNLQRVDENVGKLADAINDNTAKIAEAKQSAANAEAQATAANQAAAKTAEAAESVAKSAESVISSAASAATSATTAATKAGEAIAAANAVDQKWTDAKKDMTDAAADAAAAKKEATDNTLYVKSAVSTMENYRDQTTERVNEFEGNVNARVDTIHNEVGEVKASIQGAIQDSASALIKSTHAEEVANQANLTASRVEAGLAQEIVDRKADVERGVSEAKAYTDEKFKDFDNKITEAKKFAAAGAASALAASQIPQVSQGSAFSLGLGLGNYAGQSALGIGMSARLGDYTVTKIAFTSDTMSQVSTGVGIAVEW